MTGTKREFKGSHLAIILVCFFGVIVAVNFSMAYIARSNWTGLVVKNSYVASQHFNSELEAAKRQREAGWTSKFSYNSSLLRVSVKNAAGHPISVSHINAEIGRPAFEQMDHKVTFSALGNGQFEALDTLKPGLWKIVLTADISGLPYRRDVRFFVTKDGKGLIQ